MNSDTKVTRPVLRYHGGKWRLAPWIIAHFPSHRVYVEPFGGAASVLMRKARAELVDVFNEIDPEIVNVFAVLRDPAKGVALRDVLALTPYARAEFVASYVRDDDVVEQARRTIVRAFMGFGSDAASRALTGFRANGNRRNNHPAKDWANYAGAVDAFRERLAGVVVENRDAVECMRQHDAERTLHYVDPPYLHSTRSRNTVRTSKGYQFELTLARHVELATALRSLAGYVVLSGYDSPLYDELYAGWRRITRATVADHAKHRVEVLWLNERCAAALDTDETNRIGAA